jgi:hypothetical protein
VDAAKWWPSPTSSPSILIIARSGFAAPVGGPGHGRAAASLGAGVTPRVGPVALDQLGVPVQQGDDPVQAQAVGEEPAQPAEEALLR